MIRAKVLPSIEEHVAVTAATVRQRDECMPAIATATAAASGDDNNPGASCMQHTSTKHASLHNGKPLLCFSNIVVSIYG